MKIDVYHGPNLNLLENRSSDFYGEQNLAEINQQIKQQAKALQVEVECRQTNQEGELIDWIQESKKDGLVLNAAAYTHTSVGIRDAIEAINYPVVEVHLSNIHAREEFRKKSLLAPVCLGQIAGFGPQSYLLALEALTSQLEN